MMEPSHAIQRAVRDRLVATSGVTSIIPASSIVDRHDRPALDHSIVIGEGITAPDDGLARNRFIVVADLHIWRKEAGTIGSKQVVAAIRAALASGPLAVEDYHLVDMRIARTRFLRDPGGAFSHGVLTLEARLQEVA